MTTPSDRHFRRIEMQSLPPLTLQTERPQVVKFLRVIIFAPKNEHMRRVEDSRVPRPRTRLVLPLIHRALLPNVTVDVVNADIIRSEAILKSPENNHLPRSRVHTSSMFVPRGNHISLSLSRVPRHVGQHQLVNDGVFRGRGACLQPCRAFVVVVATENIS